MDNDIYDFTNSNENFEHCEFIREALQNTTDYQYFLCVTCAQCFIMARDGGKGTHIDTNVGLFCMALRSRMDQGANGLSVAPVVDCTFFVPRGINKD